MMDDVFRFADELGPEKIVHVHQPALGLKAILVIDNIAAGASIGGVRMAPDVSLDECFRLARAMTMKNAAAGLPHGGGKAVIFADPHMDPAGKEELIRAFARAIADETGYIPGPDMGTDETAMAWIHDETGRSIGLPAVIGGIPLDEIGATGFGLAAAAKIAAPHCGLDLKGARVAIQGFGSVGTHAARFLCREGAVLVAASDSRGTVHNPDGLDAEALIAFKAGGKSVADSGMGEAGDSESIIGVDCDIWIPAARPDVIHAGNADAITAKLILQGANIPATQEAEEMLQKRGVLIVPDFIANAGGVICAAVEYRGGTEAVAFQVIEEKITANTRTVLQRAGAEKIMPRQAAESMARERVDAAMGFRRWSARA
jgi:glutamate dehydrogenase (NAD(P)+)